MFQRLRHLFSPEVKSTDLTALIDAAATTAAGIAVGPERALRCAPVFAAVRIRCEVLGSLPLHLYERRSDGGGKDRATDHPLYRLLNARPNPWTSAADFIMRLEKDVLTHGGGFALANRAGDRVVELIRLPPGSVVEMTDDRTLEPSYRVTLKDDTTRTYPWQDILHVPALDGLAAVQQAREAIALTIALEKHAAGLLKNGARPGGALKVKRRLSNDTYERLKAQFSQSYAGTKNAGKTIILEDDVDFTPLTFSSVDIEFQAMRAFQLLEISRAFGVPPTLLSDFGRATWSNAEQMAATFLSFTILPRLKLWQGAISRLLTEDEQQRFFPEFLVDAVVKADTAARFEAYSKAIAARIYSPNEIRAKENAPPYAGGDEHVNPNISTPEPSAASKLGLRAVT